MSGANSSVIEYVGFGVHTPFRIDAYLQPFFLNESQHRAHRCLVLISLVHQTHSVTQILNSLLGDLPHHYPFLILPIFHCILKQIKPLIPFRQSLQRLTVGGIADEQTDFRQFLQLLSDRLQARKEQIAYGKMGFFGR